MHRTWKSDAYWLAPHGLPSFPFFYNLKPPVQGLAIPSTTLTFIINNKKCSIDWPIGNLGGAFSQLGISSQITLPMSGLQCVSTLACGHFGLGI